MLDNLGDNDQIQHQSVLTNSTGEIVGISDTWENLREKVNGLTLEESLEKVGGWGRFQTFLLVSMILAMNSAGLVELGVVYLELDPNMLCYLASDPTSLVECTRE